MKKVIKSILIVLLCILIDIIAFPIINHDFKNYNDGVEVLSSFENDIKAFVLILLLTIALSIIVSFIKNFQSIAFLYVVLVFLIVYIIYKIFLSSTVSAIRGYSVLLLLLYISGHLVLSYIVSVITVRIKLHIKNQ